MTDVGGFPGNIVAEMKPRFETLMPDHTVVERPLRQVDPARSVGVYMVDWTPVQDSHEIGAFEPTLQRYLIRIQNMVKAAEEIHGKALFVFDSKTVRVVLYRDTVLRVRLPSLTEDILGTRERVTRWGVARQRFVNTGALETGMIFVAQTDVWVETESNKL